MQKSVLYTALFPATLSLASCSAAPTGDSTREVRSSPTATEATGGAAGEAVALPGDTPFIGEDWGSFEQPWALAVEPGTGNVFITEQAGTMKFVQPANGRMGFVEAGLPQVAYGGQGGLGDFVFAPDYETSRTVYLSWAQDAGGGRKRAVVGRGTLVCEEHDSCRIDGLREIWRQSIAVRGEGHYSHRIAFSPDGHLFVASGDRQQKTPAQDLSNNLGTIVRLLPDGSAAPGNPFASRGTPTDQIWSWGHRNILGLVFDTQGQLWGLEHGPAGGDEMNLIERGANYGWPERSNGDNYDGTSIPDHAPDDGFQKPVISWSPVIAPGDFIFYTGEIFPQWQGQALIANLKTKSIVRATLDAGSATGTEEARYRFPERLRDIAQGPDGAIWVIEDGEDGSRGRLLRLIPRDGGDR